MKVYKTLDSIAINHRGATFTKSFKYDGLEFTYIGKYRTINKYYEKYYCSKERLSIYVLYIDGRCRDVYTRYEIDERFWWLKGVHPNVKMVSKSSKVGAGVV